MGSTKHDGDDLLAVIRAILEQVDPNASIRERVETLNRIIGRFLDSQGLLDDKPQLRAYVRRLLN